MALGRISSIDATKGQIDRDGASNIVFHKTDNPNLEWDLETLRGKRCSFSPKMDERGIKTTAVDVQLI